MNLGHLSIERPILAIVLSIFILIIGGIAYTTLPVSEYPEVAPPTIVVQASYPGASAQTVADTVATPIEQEVNGVEDMLYMYSQSTGDGRMTLTVTFKLGTDLDDAQVLVQNRVAIAEARLPEEVRRGGVQTRKSSPDLMMVVFLLSPDETYDQLYISNYALRRVRDELLRLDGVGDIQIFGARDYSMRIWLDPDKIAAVGMTAGEVVAAIRAQNVQIAGGQIGEPPISSRDFQPNLMFLGRLADADAFDNIIVKSSQDGRIVRLRDVARVELGALQYSTNSYLLRKPAVALAVFQRPGSNALATAERVEDGDGEALAAVSEGIDLQQRLQSDRVHRRVGQRADQDDLRGHRPGGDRRTRLPAALACSDHSDHRDPGVVDRDLRSDGGARLLREQPDLVRPRARGRHRGRRRDRGRGERRAAPGGGAGGPAKRPSGRWTKWAARWFPSRWCCARCSCLRRSCPASPASSSGSSPSPSPWPR